MCVDEAHECRYCAHVIHEDNQAGRVAAYGGGAQCRCAAHEVPQPLLWCDGMKW